MTSPRYYVVAHVEADPKVWTTVLDTDDQAYAQATLADFQSAGVKARIDTIIPATQNPRKARTK
jgi:hypothetical protein